MLQSNIMTILLNLLTQDRLVILKLYHVQNVKRDKFDHHTA